MSSQAPGSDVLFWCIFFFSFLRARFHKAGLTSDDGQLSVDSDFALRVLGNAFVDVLVARRSQGLDSEHGASSLVKLNGLPGGEGENTKVKCYECGIQMAAVSVLVC